MEKFKHTLDRKERKVSRNFASPTRDQLSTGKWMAGGDSHGVGFRTPVGKEKCSSIEKGPIPMKSMCIDPNEVA